MDNKLPEAPKSATVKVISPNGFHWLCTVRGDDKTSLLADMEKFEESVLAKNWKPELPPVRGGGFAPKPVEYVEGRVCPTDGAKLIHATKRDGTKFIKCENNKWVNNQQTGCKFVEWSQANYENS